jgi:hypothetical protein
MPAFGQDGLVKNPGAIYKVELSGFATYDKSYTGIVTGPIPFVQGDVADEWPNLVLMTLTLTETGTACDHTRIDLHYEGKDVNFTTPETSLDISVDFTTSQEPIETHPQFVAQIGGSPSHPLHGAFFDSTTGEFLGFPVIDPDEPDVTPSRFAGLRSYLMPQQTFVSNSVEFSYPDSTEIDNVGKVFDPAIPLPTLPGIRVQNIANTYYRQQITGMLSGPRKWILEVYGGG